VVVSPIERFIMLLHRLEDERDRHGDESVGFALVQDDLDDVWDNWFGARERQMFVDTSWHIRENVMFLWDHEVMG